MTSWQDRSFLLGAASLPCPRHDTLHPASRCVKSFTHHVFGMTLNWLRDRSASILAVSSIRQDGVGKRVRFQGRYSVFVHSVWLKYASAVVQRSPMTVPDRFAICSGLPERSSVSPDDSCVSQKSSVQGFGIVNAGKRP